MAEKSKNEHVTEDAIFFESIAPLDNVKNDAAFKALDFALSSEQKSIHNIAISGPLGAGKTSLWRSYCKEHNLGDKTIEISFARFNDPKKKKNCCKCEEKTISSSSRAGTKAAKATNDSEETKCDIKCIDETHENEIERGIIQQLTYHGNSDDLPRMGSSRIRYLKEWQTGVLTLFISLVIELLAFYFDFFSYEGPYGDFYRFLVKTFAFGGCFNWIALFLIGASTLFVVFCVVEVVYLGVKRYLPMNISKISVKEIDVSLDSNDSASLFDRNLASIVYFFEKKQVRNVVFEDLDCYASVEIFVKLRELNTILNNYGGLKDQIKFVYMVRDNLFTKYERTKFFEFIVPVIPFVNMENCADYIIELKQKKSYLRGIDEEFIRDIGLYINDTRIVNDCLNEYQIYRENLKKYLDFSKKFVEKRIFAMVLYKNFYPDDFDLLHRHKGCLYKIMTGFNSHTSIKTSLDKVSLNDVFDKPDEGCVGWIEDECLKLDLKIDCMSDSPENKEKLNQAKNYGKKSLLFCLLSNGYIEEDYDIYISQKHGGGLKQDDYKYLMTVMSKSAPEIDLWIPTLYLVERRILPYQWKLRSVLNVWMMIYELMNYHYLKKNKDLLDQLVNSMLLYDKGKRVFYNKFVEILDNVVNEEIYFRISEDRPAGKVRFNLVRRNVLKKEMYCMIIEHMDENTLSTLFGDK